MVCWDSIGIDYYEIFGSSTMLKITQKIKCKNIYIGRKDFFKSAIEPLVLEGLHKIWINA